MRPYLVFALYGPMAAYGGVAVGERRAGEPRPMRSALLGMLAASHGITRDKVDLLAAIEHGYGLAVRVDAAGIALSDYQTAQVPASRRGVRYATRATELAVKGDLETVLSRRDYRTDSLHTVAIWAKDHPPIALEALADGLRTPAFVLSIGRKSCPLGLPPAPEIVTAPDVLTAMAARVVPQPEQTVRQRLAARPSLLATDPGGMASSPRWTEMRRDAVASRARWQFSLRAEQVFDLTQAGAA